MRDTESKEMVAVGRMVGSFDTVGSDGGTAREVAWERENIKRTPTEIAPVCYRRVEVPQPDGAVVGCRHNRAAPCHFAVLDCATCGKKSR